MPDVGNVLLKLRMFLVISVIIVEGEAAGALSPWALLPEAVFHQRDATSGIFFVDIREPEAFARYHVPGSLNIPVFAVKTKLFLKSKPLILIDEGYHPRHLQETCEELRQLGFEASFLWGGLLAWQRAGGIVQGDVFALRTLNRMPAQDWFANQDETAWLIVNASLKEDVGQIVLSPHTLHLPFDPTETESFTARLHTAVSGLGKVLILMFTQDGTQYAELERVLSDAELPPVFFLTGGYTAYAAVITQHRLILDGQRQTPTPCSSCTR